MSLIDATHRRFLAGVDGDIADSGRREVVIHTPLASYTVDVEFGDWRLVHGGTAMRPLYLSRAWADARVAVGDLLELGANCSDWAVTRKALLALAACESPEDAIEVRTGLVLLPEVEEWMAAADEDFGHMVRAEVER